MENFYDTKGRRLGSFTGKSNDSMRSKIPRQHNFLPGYREKTEVRARARPFGKYPKQNRLEFPECQRDSINHKTTDGRISNSPSGTIYPYYDNQPHVTKISETDYNETEIKEENIPEEFTEYRSNRDAFNSETSSDSSESERSWEEPRKERRTNASFLNKTPRQTEKGFARRKMKKKKEATRSQSVYFQEEFLDHHQICSNRNRSRNEAPPQISQQPDVHPNATQCEKHQMQSYNEFYDGSHDSANWNIPRGYKPSTPTYSPYGNQLYAENNLVTKYTSSTDTDADDKQTEPQTMHRRRRKVNNLEVTFINSGSSGQQKTSKGTDPGILFRNESEKKNWRTTGEMNQGVYQNRESKYSYNPQLYAKNTAHSVTKCACSGELDNDDRQTEEQETYEKPKACGRRRNLGSSEVIFMSGKWLEQTPKATSLKNSTQKKMGNRHIRWATEEMNQLGNGQNVYYQEGSSDYSDECTGKRNYWVGEDSRGQYFCPKSDKDFSEAVYGAKGRNTRYENQGRIEPSRRKEIERNSSEAERWGGDQEVSMNSGRHHIPYWQRNHQEREQGMCLDCGYQEKNNFAGRVSCCGNGEYNETACKHDNSDGRRANSSCEGYGNDVTETTPFVEIKRSPQWHGNSDDHVEKQLCEGNHYMKERRCNPALSCGDHSHNSFHEITNFRREEPCPDDLYRENNFGCAPPAVFGDYSPEDNTHLSSISNPTRLRRNNDWNESDNYRSEQTSGFVDSRSFTRVNRQNVEGKSASMPVTGKEKIYKNAYEAYDSMLYPQEHEDLERMSRDYRSVHESNICAVQNTVMDGLVDFGSKLEEAIVSCHVSLELFRATYEEWIKTRDATLRISRALEAEIRHDGNWQSGFRGFCEFLKTAGKVTEKVLRLTPYAGIVPVVQVIPPAIKKLGDVIIGAEKEKKKKDFKCADMLQVLQADIEESSQLKMFALQCEMQFKETEKLLVEFMDVVSTQQMADCVEDMGLLNFLIDLSDADPSSDSFFRRISEAYRKFHNTGKEESPSTWEAFCGFIDRYPSILDTLQNIDWHFTRSFENQRDVNDLNMCWSTISNLASNTMKAEEALSRVATIIRILETQRNYVIANVSKLF